MAKKGIHRSVETEWGKGEHPNLDTEFKKGQVPWNKGIPMSDVSKARLSVSLKPIAEARRGKPRLELRRRIIKVCPRCGKAFETGGRAGRRDKVYCSIRCARMVKNGITMHTAGYVQIMQKDGSRKLEHRIIAEQTLGRKLVKGEVVHHLNGIKTDNRPENLLVMTQAQHRALTDYLANLWVAENPDRVEQVSKEFLLPCAF